MTEGGKEHQASSQDLVDPAPSTRCGTALPWHGKQVVETGSRGHALGSLELEA